MGVGGGDDTHPVDALEPEVGSGVRVVLGVVRRDDCPHLRVLSVVFALYAANRDVVQHVPVVSQ